MCYILSWYNIEKRVLYRTVLYRNLAFTAYRWEDNPVQGSYLHFNNNNNNNDKDNDDNNNNNNHIYSSADNNILINVP